MLEQSGSRADSRTKITDRAEGEKAEHDPQRKTKIADAIDQERFFGRVPGRGLFVVISNQQIRAETHAFPTQIEHDEVVAHHQAGHRKNEQPQIGEEAEISFFAFHISGRVHGDEESDPGNHAEHHGRERIEKETGLGGECAGGNPIVIILNVPERFSARLVSGLLHSQRQRDRHHRRQPDADPDRPMGISLEPSRPEKSGDGRPQQRQQRNQVGVFDHPMHRGNSHPFNWHHASASSVFFCLNSSTTNPSASDASAAAITSTKITNACPARFW